jgi:hypothetical protein
VAIREILGIFGEASCPCINYNKSTATIIMGAEEEERVVRNTLRRRELKITGNRGLTKPFSSCKTRGDVLWKGHGGWF